MRGGLETVLLVIGILSGCSLSLRNEVIDNKDTIRREVYTGYQEREHIVAPLIIVEFRYESSKKYCDNKKKSR